MFQNVLVMEQAVEVSQVKETTFSNRFVQKEITLEYPPGVKLSVDVSDIEVVAQLIKL